MAIVFDEVLLSPFYTNLAEGGPEWATDIQRSGLGGGISNRNQNREDYISKYEIEYAELTFDKLTNLRKFAILRRGMSRGFRFHPPDDSVLEGETAGMLNQSNAEIEQMSTTDGTTKRFYAIKTFEDAGTENYVRWMVKLSSLDEVKIEALSGGAVIATAIVPAVDQLVAGQAFSLGSVGAGAVAYNFGIIEFNTAPSSGIVLQITARFHLPVAFNADWAKFRVDDSAISDFGIGIEELLPAELAISPSIILPDIQAPTIPTLTATAQSGAVKFTWTASTDASGIDEYELEIEPAEVV